MRTSITFSMGDLLRLQLLSGSKHHTVGGRHFIHGHSPLYEEAVHLVVTTDELQAVIDHLIDLHFECQQADTTAALTDLASTEVPA